VEHAEVVKKRNENLKWLLVTWVGMVWTLWKNCLKRLY